MEVGYEFTQAFIMAADRPLPGICAGKDAVANYLVEHHSFSRLKIRSTTESTPRQNTSDVDDNRVDCANQSGDAFKTVCELVEFVTSRWQRQWVTTDIENEASLEEIIRRPFFLLVSIDAPLHMRWNRSRIRWVCRVDGRHSAKVFLRSSRCGEKLLSLEDFVKLDDDYVFDHKRGLTRCLDRADVRIVNATSSLSELHDTLEKINLADEQRLRPSWDQYFMQLASLAAHRSNCMKRRVGCVLVREKRVISTGYNGTPRNLRNCNEGGCMFYFCNVLRSYSFRIGPRCNQGFSSGVSLSTCLCLHAEENALLEAGRERIREGSILYCDT